MTNSKTVEKSVQNEKEKFVKPSVNSKKKLGKIANVSSREEKSNPKTRSMKSDEQNLKNVQTKLRSTRNNNVILYENNVEQNSSNSDEKKDSDLNNSVNSYNLDDNKTCINKEKRINSIRKAFVSPNHKLTEYFSDLRVHENINDDESKKALKIKENKSSEKLNISNSDKLSSGISGKTKQKKQPPRVQSSIESTNHKVTEYFHVRRSKRKYTKNIIDEKQKDLQVKILNEVEDGLMVTEFEGKGRGIITTKEFKKGDFVIEYIGDLIDGLSAKQREIKYSKNKNIGCYMYYFKFNNQQYCIDATKESGKLGRLVNHSRKGNLISKIIELNKTPHLVLFAKLDIPADTEVLYDYGDRNPESVQNHPWLAL